MANPPGAQVATAHTRDGVALRTLRWPAIGTTRAHLVLLHGIAEHAGRHAQVAARFARAGIETLAYDLRGFGASSGRRAYVDHWAQHHDDLEHRLAELRASAGGRPIVLYGHSMGGLIALGYVLADLPRPQPDVLVLSAPAIAASVAGWKRALAGVLGRALPRLAIPNELPPGALSHDQRVETAYRADPLNVHRTTARFGHELFREQARVRSRLSRTAAIPMPTYVLHGSDDAIVPPSCSASLEGKGNVTRRVYAGLRHEMHNEAEADAVIGDTIAWLERAFADREP